MQHMSRAVVAGSGHVLLLDTDGRVRWASPDLLQAMALDGPGARTLRMRTDSQWPGSARQALAAIDGAVVRMKCPGQPFCWYRVGGIVIDRGEADEGFVLMELQPTAVEDQASEGLQLALARDRSTGLLTWQALHDRLAHPSWHARGPAAVIGLCADSIDDLPWGTSQTRWDAAVRSMSASAMQMDALMDGGDAAVAVALVARRNEAEVLAIVPSVDSAADALRLADRLRVRSEARLRSDLAQPSAIVQTTMALRRPEQPWADAIERLATGAFLDRSIA